MKEIFFSAVDNLISAFDAKAERRFIKGLVSFYATGNVPAQQGRFVISKEIERRKKNILSYRFA